jgi:hypothetical protein
MDTEAGSAAGLLTGTDSLGYVAGDGIVARGETCGGDGCGGIGSGDDATVGGPGIGGFLLQVEVAGCGGDGDGVAGEDVCGLHGAAKLDGWRRCDLAEAEDDAGGEAISEDIAGASGDQARAGRTVVDVGIIKVGLNRSDSDAVIEGRQDVIEADAAGDTPAPGAGLEDGASNLGSAAEDVGKGDKTILLACAVKTQSLGPLGKKLPSAWTPR